MNTKTDNGGVVIPISYPGWEKCIEKYIFTSKILVFNTKFLSKSDLRNNAFKLT